MSATERPSIYTFRSMAAFTAAMLAWQKEHGLAKSQRQLAASCGISHTQLSRIASGKREVTRNVVDPLSTILKLTTRERNFLDQWVKHQRQTDKVKNSREIDGAKSATGEAFKNRVAQNHLLSDWLNVYIKDLAKVKGFRPDPFYIHQMLGGMASIPRIRRSLEFLVKQGFLRRDLKGRVQVNETLVVSSDGLPSHKIRAFHQHALDVAKKNIERLPMDRRRESAMVMHLNEKSIQELQLLLKDFYERLLDFAEQHPDDNEHLCQVLINFTTLTHHAQGGQK